MGDWLNDNYNWLVPTIVAALIALLLGIKQIKKNKKASLFEQSFKLYFLIKKHFDTDLNNDFSGILKLEELLSDSRNPFLDEVKLSEAKLLFGKRIYKQIKNLIKKSNLITEKKNCADKVHDFLVTSSYLRQDLKDDFEEVVSGFFEGKRNYTEESLKSISSECVIRNRKLCTDAIRDYNYYELYKEKKDLIIEFKEGYYILIKDIEAKLKF